MSSQYLSTVTAAGLTILLLVTTLGAQNTNRLHDTCVYSFKIPKAQMTNYGIPGSGCPGMTELEQEVEELKRSVKLLQEQLAATMTQQSLTSNECTKLNADMLGLLQRSIDSGNSGPGTVKPSTTNSPNAGGGGAATYIRWGRKVCPEHAERLYVGYAGGTHYSLTGGSSNYLCLPVTPEWTNKTTNGFQGGSKVYGAEYELGTLPQFSREHNSGQTLHDHDVPCAACYVPQRAARIMIPGLVQCPAGWTLEYSGYVVSAHDTHKHPVGYECLDGAPEVVNAGGSNVNGALMYLTEVTCGPLPCPKYVSGWELSCVVCTK